MHGYISAGPAHKSVLSSLKYDNRQKNKLFQLSFKIFITNYNISAIYPSTY